MIKSYLSSFYNALFSLTPSKTIRLLLMVLFVLAQTIAFGQITGDYRSNGNVTFNAANNWQIYNGSWVNTTIAPKDATYTTSNTITVRSGHAATVSITVTIAAQLTVLGTFTLNSSANLSIGPIVVDNSGTPFTVNAGSALTVNGNFTVKKGDMSVAGTIYIDGNFSTETGNVDVVGTGSMASSGSMTTQGGNGSTIFGSTGDCGVGPCSGTSLDCQSTISAPQTICQNSQSTPITLTGRAPTVVTTVVKWQSTKDFLTFTDIANTTTTLPAQTITQTTRFRAVYTSSGCSGNINSPYATVTVTPAAVGGTVLGGTTICSGSTSGLLTLTGNAGNVVRWESAVSPFSSWSPLTNTSNTYISEVLTQTTQFRAVVRRGTCTSANSATTTVTISPSNTWTGTTSASWFTSTNWSCGIVPILASDVVIPNVTRKPIIDDSSKIALANTITVSSGSSLTVNSGNTLKATNAVTNSGSTITFKDSASLLQTNNVTNLGNIKYERNYTGEEMDYTYWSSPVLGQKLLDLSPSTKLDKFFSFSGTDWVQEIPSTTTMTAGKGYIIRGIPPPTGLPVGFGTLSFNGVPNNGNQSIAVVAGTTSNLIGNPYPSAIDADVFILANTAAIDGTLYFWTHNTPIAIGTPNPGTGALAYSGNDYATYTLSGGVATKIGNFTPEWVDSNKNRIVDSGEFSDKNGNGTLNTAEWTDSNTNNILETGEWTDTNKNNIAETGEWTDKNNDGILNLPAEWTDTNSNGIKEFAEWTDTNGNEVFNTGEWSDVNFDKILNLEVEQVSKRPTGKIVAGQSFFTTSTTAGGPVIFTNAMRLDGSGNPLNNSNFYKTKNPKAKTSLPIEKNRVWLNLTNKEGAFKQTLVGYISGATNTWDSLYDGESYDGNDFLDFYSINQEKKLTIQGRALPFDENDEIPLGYRIEVAGKFTINIDETDRVLANQDIFIEDKLTNKTVNLKSEKYTFTTEAGTFDERFVLRYTNKTLGKEEVELNDGIIALYSNNYKTFIIRNNTKDASVNAVGLSNMLGQNIANWEVDDSEQINIQIPIKNISPGIYIVKIKTTKGDFSKKIIIK